MARALTYRPVDPSLRVVLAPEGAGKSWLVRCLDAGDDFDAASMNMLIDVGNNTAGGIKRKMRAVQACITQTLHHALLTRREVQFTRYWQPVVQLVRDRQLDPCELAVWTPARCPKEAALGFSMLADLLSCKRSCSPDLDDLFSLYVSDS